MYNINTITGPSFSLKNRIGRVFWGIAFQSFFRLSPKSFHSWRAMILRAFGAKVGSGVHVYPNVKIWAPWNLNLGNQCGIANGAILYSQGKITIGSRTIISQGAHLCAGTHDYTQPGFPLVTKPIFIGNQVWIAAEAFIHAGVTIKEGAVIGARSVVSKDMPAWMVCSGFPCKPIKSRIMESQSNPLQEH